MKKYAHTKQGMKNRRQACISQSSKHAPGRQFNSANGEPHTKKWLDDMRAFGLRRKR